MLENRIKLSKTLPIINTEISSLQVLMIFIYPWQRQMTSSYKSREMTSS